jgi:Glutamyl-tRNA reductase
MNKKINFCVIGGDARGLFMAEALMKDGHNVKIYGYSQKKIRTKIKPEKDIDTAIHDSDFVILPVPVTRDGKTLNAPFFDTKVNLDDEFTRKLETKTIFCGGFGDFLSAEQQWKNLHIIDYASREDFAILNAVPTAEGAIRLAMQEYEGTIDSGNFLVVGFGRIGKILAKNLKNMGGKVTVSARSASDLAWIQALGYEPIETNNLPEFLDYDVIFNTVPYKIFDRDNLLKCSEGVKIIDLASSPGGVELDIADFLDIKVISALGLPGKFSPKTAGEIIKKTIYKIMKEEGLWKK